MRIKIVLICIIYAIFISSCANTDIYRGGIYSPDQVKRVKTIRYGTILSVYPVKIQASDKGLGKTYGAIIGGSSASTIGGVDRTNIIAGATGALVGSIIGGKIEEKVNQVNALELEIAVDNGQKIVVIQKFQHNLRKGTRVRIVGDDNNVNINPI